MAMFLMLFFSFNQSPRRNSKILNHLLSSILLMAVSIYDFLLKFWTIGSSFSVYRKSRMAISTKKSLGLISPHSILFSFTTMTFETVGHD